MTQVPAAASGDTAQGPRGQSSDVDAEALETRYDALNAELDAALASVGGRLDGMQTRAGTLIGAAAIIGTINVNDEATWWLPLNLGLAFVAGVLGLYATAPSTGRFLSVKDLQTEFNTTSPLWQIKKEITDEKVSIYYWRVEKLRSRARWITVGFYLVAASLLVSLIGSFYPGQPSSDDTSGAFQPRASEVQHG